MVGQRKGVCSIGWDLKMSGNGGMAMAGLAAYGGAMAKRGWCGCGGSEDREQRWPGGRRRKKIRSRGRRLLQVEMDFRVRFPLFFLYFSFKISPPCFEL